MQKIHLFLHFLCDYFRCRERGKMTDNGKIMPVFCDFEGLKSTNFRMYFTWSMMLSTENQQYTHSGTEGVAVVAVVAVRNTILQLPLFYYIYIYLYI